ncbi:hypothetical protein [Natrinema marinum]|uniref:hypothetical protein n=1 Tax=Natrinema marinum TaxID=2961598 RepID=UPI0020C8AACE|nr:hypothetical protein [Natrinema marinum]
MERRKILLGSGAAIATVLAGCSSDETGDDTDSNDDDSDDSLNGDGNGESDGSDDKAEIPGLDRDKLKIDSEKVSIEDMNKDGKTVNVVATTTTTDPDTLFAELDSLGEDMSAAITDPDAFAAAVDSVAWILEKDGAKVMSFYVDVEWAIKYRNGELSQDAFVDRVLETTDETQ